MANHDRIPVLWQFVQKTGADPAHGGENTALDVTDLSLPVLADIEQREMCLSRT